MKIAVVTDDGNTVSQHFGRATHYSVLEIQNGQILKHEMREKQNHRHFANEHQEHTHVKGLQHGFDATSQGKHDRMFEVITDCEALICRGMGAGAYQNMMEHGIRPIVTDIANVEEAALAYVRGEIVDHVEKLH
ncbi:MAG: dinitrogenase iron-molybdenum cofactor biosynthesis protein [Anaerolineales bacterium]|nr:dinitrogenase iron-molybdenum cofactor biosynthesis protein [Anaerolineales bacterium]